MDDATASWSGAEQYDGLGPAAEHEFGNLIDFDNLDIDFSIDYSNPGQANHHDSSQQLSDLADSLDVQHLQNHFPASVSQDPRDNGGPGSQQQNAMGQADNGFFDFDMPTFSQANTPAFSAAQDQVFRPHMGVPPTPNSVEMHGNSARYLQQMDPQQTLFEQRYQMRKEDASFTPLVSPAITPHEARFQIPDFTTVPGVYFSPLTSPALSAQHQRQHPHAQYNTSGSSAGTSPVDVDMDMLGEAAMPQPEPARKLRSNKRNVPRSTNARTRVPQSPIAKSARRKATVSSTIQPKEVSDLLEEAQRARSDMTSSAGLPVPRSSESSGTESISPEPLSDMGPPPKPSSVTHSPALVAKGGHNPGASSGACPATPTSLMRLQQSPGFAARHEMPPLLEELTLPEAADDSADRPSLSRVDTVVRDDDQPTPQVSARKTPKLGPLSTPSATAALSGKPSPMLSAMTSPTSPGFMAGPGRRTSKKRNSTSSALVSPALRPKISPSIKPLLPEGSVSDDTHALLLASKSNYQNILDGTTVPGVTYPTSLSTNLTSKRTSHKIAEQGRRNRINTALMEMQQLLPSPQILAGDAKSPDSAGGSQSQSNNSKAAKVESAIEYIKQLQKQCSEKDNLLDKKDQEMEALRKELAALRRSNSVGSSSNPAESETQMKSESKSGSEAENAT
ncbi:hypothetical protein BCR34DRAFT_37427 [Clohesyomyces aquaticus]|uniref:BHLH domain-containing protein n=1 Tax=Clohesyomyces aquaticus TaxID=1231657 RepID=A0A1Y2A4I7_9PLEO|nr:hypothetical protein BCR34DRAFT_37427 [Clohesyomyces aquaticus]